MTKSGTRIPVYLLVGLATGLFNLHADAITLVRDPAVGMMLFASDNIKTSLQQKSNSFYEVPLTQLSQAPGTRIVLAQKSNTEVTGQITAESGTLPAGIEPQGYAIIVTSFGDRTTYWIIGGDDAGAMYGGLEVAEIIKLAGISSVTKRQQNPFLEKRGLKLNIPLDARTPSYSDAGSAAQANIPEMWNWDFWTNHLDNLARHRYNVITLWSLHHFPSLVKVPEYPDVALDDVKRSTINFKNWFPSYHNEGTNMYNQEIASNLETLKTISIDEKIKFWQDVMQYAHDRGIEFHLITWNVFVSSAGEHYGIDRNMNNATTIDYIRKSVKATFETYPLLGGVGVTAGEGMPGASVAEKEDWLWSTYGAGLMDAFTQNPDRRYRFIHRYWWSDIGEIMNHFTGMNDNVEFDFSYKYNRARLYSSTNPSFADDALGTLPDGMKFWWNLRNDDIFNFRWGDPDFVREFINNFPGDNQTIGFHMGSDGYVWGREHTSREPQNPRQLEVEKHWYKFMLWGRLGYDPELTNVFFEQQIAEKFPQASATTLFQLWQRASKIIPAVNRAHWHDWDFQWSVEYCKSRSGFHDINENQWTTGDADVAEEISGHAQYVLDNITSLRSTGGKELRQTLGDLEAMAHLGNYYAEKFLAADVKGSNNAQARVHLTSAAGHWRQYAAIAGGQYNPQLLGRGGWADFRESYGHVLNDISLVGGQANSPSLFPTPGGTILEAEEAALQGSSSGNSITDFTGSGYVVPQNTQGWIEWTFNAPQAGEYILEFRYVMDGGSETLALQVNGADAGSIDFWDTGGPSSWAWDRKPVLLTNGSNTIRLLMTSTNPSVDHLNILYSGTGTAVKPQVKIPAASLNSVSARGVRFNLHQPGPVQLTLYDLQGNIIENVSRHFEESGIHQFSFSSGNLTSQVLILRMQVREQAHTRRFFTAR